MWDCSAIPLFAFTISYYSKLPRYSRGSKSIDSYMRTLRIWSYLSLPCLGTCSWTELHPSWIWWSFHESAKHNHNIYQAQYESLGPPCYPLFSCTRALNGTFWHTVELSGHHLSSWDKHDVTVVWGHLLSTFRRPTWSLKTHFLKSWDYLLKNFFLWI